MYSKEEKRALNQAFWTAFGSYMKPCQSEFYKKVNWSNYKTGVKQIYIRFHVEPKHYEFSIEIQDSDEVIRSLFFEQFEELRSVLNQEYNDETVWVKDHQTRFGNYISKIFVSCDQYNYHNKQEWAALFKMMRTHITAFDRFWYDWKDTFTELAR